MIAAIRPVYKLHAKPESEVVCQPPYCMRIELLSEKVCENVRNIRLFVFCHGACRTGVPLPALFGYLLSILRVSYFYILSSVPPIAHTGVIFTTHHQWLPRQEGCLLSQPQKTGRARAPSIQSIELSKYIVRWAPL